MAKEAASQDGVAPGVTPSIDFSSKINDPSLYYKTLSDFVAQVFGASVSSMCCADRHSFWSRHARYFFQYHFHLLLRRLALLLILLVFLEGKRPMAKKDKENIFSQL